MKIDRLFQFYRDNQTKSSTENATRPRASESVGQSQEAVQVKLSSEATSTQTSRSARLAEIKSQVEDGSYLKNQDPQKVAAKVVEGLGL